jgi:hypothetical protein
MKRLSLILVVFYALIFCASVSAGGPNGQGGNMNVGQLNEQEIADLVAMREEEKLARDVYITLHGLWQDMIFLNISVSEQRHMDAMLRMLNLYGVEDPVVDDMTGEFSTQAFRDLYEQLVGRGEESLYEALRVGGYVEELDIRDLLVAIGNTDEKPLLGSYNNLLAGARNHLRAFVAHIQALGYEYEPQLMTTEELQAIVGDYPLAPPGNFSINAGLSDAWYYPATDGQGFVITVYPGAKTVFLVWFTYDTELPAEDDTANLGDPGQRWLVAQGGYSGAWAELEVGSMSGGLFDSEEPVPVRTPGGSILLQFENCNSGSVFYDIPSIGRTGMVPIQRVNSENVAVCNQPGGSNGPRR